MRMYISIKKKERKEKTKAEIILDDIKQVDHSRKLYISYSSETNNEYERYLLNS